MDSKSWIQKQIHLSALVPVHFKKSSLPFCSSKILVPQKNIPNNFLKFYSNLIF